MSRENNRLPMLPPWLIPAEGPTPSGYEQLEDEQAARQARQSGAPHPDPSTPPPATEGPSVWRAMPQPADPAQGQQPGAFGPPQSGQTPPAAPPGRSTLPNVLRVNSQAAAAANPPAAAAPSPAAPAAPPARPASRLPSALTHGVTPLEPAAGAHDPAGQTPPSAPAVTGPPPASAAPTGRRPSPLDLPLPASEPVVQPAPDPAAAAPSGQVWAVPEPTGHGTEQSPFNQTVVLHPSGQPASPPPPAPQPQPQPQQTWMAAHQQAQKLPPWAAAPVSPVSASFPSPPAPPAAPAPPPPVQEPSESVNPMPSATVSTAPNPPATPTQESAATADLATPAPATEPVPEDVAPASAEPGPDPVAPTASTAEPAAAPEVATASTDTGEPAPATDPAATAATPAVDLPPTATASPTAAATPAAPEPAPPAPAAAEFSENLTEPRQPIAAPAGLAAVPLPQAQPLAQPPEFASQPPQFPHPPAAPQPPGFPQAQPYGSQAPYGQQPPAPAQGGPDAPHPSIEEVPLLRRARKSPDKGWRRTVHHLSRGAIHPGQSADALRLRDLIERLRQPTQGDYRIAVLSLKGGVGKTTTTIGLGSTFASMRGDRVIAVDANPDLGTLSMRIPLQTRSTVRDLLDAGEIQRYSDVRAHTSQSASRLEVLASDRDPAASEAFSEADYRRTITILQRFYNIVITDCGTGLMHSAMDGVLDLAHALVLVTSPAIDGARSAAATLDWLNLHGYEELVRHSVVVLSAAGAGTPNIDMLRLRQYFLSRCRAVHAIPFDDHLAEGAEVDLDKLGKEARYAFIELAASLGDKFFERT